MTDKHKITRTIDRIALGLCVVLAVMAVSAHAWSQDYVEGMAGASFWNDTSNSDGVESDVTPGVVGLAALGWDLDYLSVDIAAGLWREELHGRNDGASNKTADGRQAYFGAVMPGLWFKQDVGRWRLYAGGGGGLGVAHAFGDTQATYAYQAGGGVVLDLSEDWAAHLAYRYVGFGETEHDDRDASFDTHTVLLGLRYGF